MKRNLLLSLAIEFSLLVLAKLISPSVHVLAEIVAINPAETLYAEIKGNIPGINKVDEGGETPLTRAAMTGSVEAVKNYIIAGADVNARNSRGYSPIMLSAQGGHYYTTLAIIDGFKSLSSRKELESTVDGDQANSEDQRINTDFRDNFGLSAILLAANNGHSDLVKLLLEKTSSNVNDRIPSSGMTALMVTSQKGLLSTAKILLEKGADPNLQSTTGESALLYASVVGYEDIVRLLISYKININKANNMGITALMLAASRGHLSVVSALIENGVDISKRDIADMSAIDYAFESNRGEIISVLQHHGAQRRRLMR